MDSKDDRILKTLWLDSRKSIREISKITGIRPSTVHQRIQKLKRDGIIKYFTVKLDYAKLNQSFVAFVLLNTNEDLPNSFFANPHIKEAYGVTGEFDLLLKLRFRDVQEFNNYLINLRKNPKIGKTLTMVSTIEIKEEI